MSVLRDRNTMAMVAAHWGCSARHVRRLVQKGELPCLNLGGVVRLTREQVEAYEAKCTSCGSTETESGTSSTAPVSASALAHALKTAQRQKCSSPISSQHRAA